MLVSISSRKFRSASVVSFDDDIASVNKMLTDCGIPASVSADPWKEHSQGVPILWRNPERILCRVRVPVSVLVDILGQIGNSEDRSVDTVYQFNLIAKLVAGYRLNRENRYIRDGLRVGRDNFVEWGSDSHSMAAQVATMGLLYPELAFATDSPCVMSGELSSKLIDLENSRGLLETWREFTLTTEGGSYVFRLRYADSADGSHLISERVWNRCKGKTRFLFPVKNGRIVGIRMRPVETSNVVSQLIGIGKRLYNMQAEQIVRNASGKKQPTLSLYNIDENRTSKINRQFGICFDLLNECNELYHSGQISENWFLVIRSLYDAASEGKIGKAYEIYKNRFFGKHERAQFYIESVKVKNWIISNYTGDHSAKPQNIRTYRNVR